MFLLIRLSNTRSAEIPHGIFKHRQAVPSFFLFAGPAGMLSGVDVPLGMWHQAENAAGFVADAGGVSLGAVGVRGIGEERFGIWALGFRI